MARTPRRYRLANLPPVYLAFRSEDVDGRELLSLVPDAEEQHVLDVATAFADDPHLVEVDLEGEPLQHCCEICGHPWAEHSPENGCCAHSYGSCVCQCGRDLAFMHRRMRGLARAATAVALEEVAAGA